MENNSEIMLLRDAGVEPTAQVLENILGAELYRIYQDLSSIATGEFGLEYEWRYYNDGKSWLFKAVHKKKTIFWLSVWDGFIRMSFIFTEKTRPGIFELPISEKIKADFDKARIVGKLIPLILDIDRDGKPDDFREIVRYKKGLK